MKIDKETRNRMADAIATLDTPEIRDAYRAGNYSRAELTKDVDRRYRWDLLWAVCGREILPRQFISDVLYGQCGANDSHIDTALRAIVPPL